MSNKAIHVPYPLTPPALSTVKNNNIEENMQFECAANVKTKSACNEPLLLKSTT